ncbi:hypothetical protein QQF64_025220 [Cirrhinus molitorella]|uniref:Uncharacterized protein n=1 Tax=Cirrhinus molitorella TaxID=172907 RepID=A0ABR3NP74_9TELE
MLIARDRLGHLSSSVFKSCRRDGSRRRSLGVLWRETGGPRTEKGQGECTEGENDGERDGGKERVKGLWQMKGSSGASDACCHNAFMAAFHLAKIKFEPDPSCDWLMLYHS